MICLLRVDCRKRWDKKDPMKKEKGYLEEKEKEKKDEGIQGNPIYIHQ